MLHLSICSSHEYCTHISYFGTKSTEQTTSRSTSPSKKRKKATAAHTQKVNKVLKEDEEVQILYTKNTKKGTQRLLHPVVVKEDKEEDIAVGTTALGTKEENKIESTKKKKTQKSIVSFFNSAPKKTEFVTIGDGSISIQLRELFRDGVMTEEQRGLEEAQLAKNYLSQISEMVKNNFQH